MPKWDPILAGITGLWLPHRLIHFLPERRKLRIIWLKTWIQSSPWFLYMGPALSPSILLKFLNLLCVSVSLSSPVFSFKNKFQQWLWQALKEEVLWVCSLGSVAGLLAAELQTALSLSTRAPLQQPPLTLVHLTAPPPPPSPSQLRVRTVFVTKNHFKQKKNREKWPTKSIFIGHWF